jgi:RNA polymerase sigma-70 factor (ECF subfamily)
MENTDYPIERIWKEFSKKIRAFVYRKVHNRAYVDDILQEVFLKIHQNIDKLEEDSKILGWIFQISQNAIIDFYRKNKLQTRDIDEIEIAERKEEKSPDWEIALGLREMVEKLPEKYSQALLLVEFEGLSQAELAEKLGISVSGAKSRVQRAREMLRDSLMQCCHFEFDKFGTIIDFHPIGCCCCSKDCPHELNA